MTIWTIVGGIVAILGLVVAAGSWRFPVAPADPPAQLPAREGLATGGTSSASPSLTGTPMVVALPPKNWSLDFSNSLSSASSWWVTGGDDAWGGSCWFDDGTYWVRQAVPERTFTCEGRALQYGDFAVEFVAVVSGRGCVDLVFRDGGRKTIYTYLVCTRGDASAYRRYTPQWEPVEVLFQRDDLAVPEDSPVKIGIVAVGARMHFFLNGEKIADAADEGSLAGRFYLRATADPEPVTVGFRDFKVWVP